MAKKVEGFPEIVMECASVMAMAEFRKNDCGYFLDAAWTIYYILSRKYI